MADPTLPAGFVIEEEPPQVPQDMLPPGFQVETAAPPAPPPPEEEGLLSRMGASLYETGMLGAEEVEEAPTGMEKLLAGAARAVKGMGDLAFDALPKSMQEDIGKSVSIAADMVSAGAESDTLEGAGFRALVAGAEQYQAFKAENPRAAKNVENVLTVLTGGIGTKLAKDVLKKPYKLISGRKSLEVLDNTLQETVSKNMIPLVGAGGVKRVKGGKGKRVVGDKVEDINLTNTQVFNLKAKQAVESIAERKDMIEYTDELGNVLGRGMPKDVVQFNEAIRHVKDDIFQEYHALARSANQAVRISTKDTIDKLTAYKNSVSVQDLAPEMANAIDDQIARLKRRKYWSPMEAEELIASLNNKTKNFQRTGQGGVFTHEADMLMLDSLRGQMDEAVEKGLDMLGKSTGRDYSALKNAYGSLLEIEKGVGAEAKRQLAKAGKQKTTLSSIISDHGLVWSLYHFNPKVAAASMSVKGLEKLRQWRKSKDRMVQQMFSKADKLVQRKAKIKADAPDVKEPVLLLPAPEAPIVPPYKPVTERGFQLVPRETGPTPTIPGRRPPQGPAGEVVSKKMDPQFSGDPFLDEKITDALRTPGFQRTAEQKTLVDSIKNASRMVEENPVKAELKNMSDDDLLRELGL